MNLIKYFIKSINNRVDEKENRVLRFEDKVEKWEYSWKDKQNL